MKSLTSYLQESVLIEILETAFQWFVVVDKESRILYINEEYCKFLEVSRQDAIGQPVDDVIENTRMHEVVETGIEHIASPHFIKGTYMLANRVPIIVDNQIVGAFGSVVFRDLNDWHNLSSHVKKTMEKMHFGAATSEQHPYRLEDIRGSSKAIRSIKETIQMIAPSELPVLIQGESGTGKELFAKSIHYLSNRSDKPFIKVNCAAIPPELLEVELFGATNAQDSGEEKQKGRIYLADGGTLFLDDIGDMPLPVQIKLLRFINEGENESIDQQSKAVNVRFIAASNQPLTKLVEQSRLREDLYYRIQTITLQVPPLRERMEDLPELTNYIFQEALKRGGKRNLEFAPQTMKYLRTYHWPGNVRELQNVIQAAVYLSSGDTIEPNALPQQLKEKQKVDTANEKTLAELLEDVERKILDETLQQHPNKLEAARILGLSRSTLYEKINKYDL